MAVVFSTVTHLAPHLPPLRHPYRALLPLLHRQLRPPQSQQQVPPPLLPIPHLPLRPHHLQPLPPVQLKVFTASVVELVTRARRSVHLAASVWYRIHVSSFRSCLCCRLGSYFPL